MGRRRRYQALLNGSAPQVWGTVTDGQLRSSKAVASAPARSWLPWKRQGPESRTRVRRSAGADGAADGEAAGAGARRHAGPIAMASASSPARCAAFRAGSRLGAIAQPAQRQLDVDDQRFGRV